MVIANKRSVTNEHDNFIGNDDKITNCSCVPYYQCSEESGRVITDGDGLLDLRGLEDNACTGYFDVCCNLTVIPNVRPIHTSGTSMALVDNTDKGCGYLKQMLVPWSGMLLVQAKKWEYKCGVSIINPRVAVTAAHCLLLTKPLVIQSNSRLKSLITSQVTKIIPHNHYNTGTLQNDIALLFLEDELIKVGTICIPPPGSLLLDRQCTVSTWKKNGKLRIIEIPLVPHQKCEKMLRKTRLGKYFQLHLSFLCAGGNSFQDACDGDGGSPLICPVPGQPGRYHQVGIVSWGIGCGERDTPGVYVNVATFRNWIDEVIQTELKKQNGGAKDGINTYRYK
ncbi:LOW QUALITY PROTEIN: phenoloxidase-activating factor 2-like [Atheta coriaria]|uniref:LOW QUALITY PROTEIN: phenoloxidase-activating factor 2-like n=1 Tax=Dalotia coriaria TaxID=877792 RepID=UPI0031F39B7A